MCGAGVQIDGDSTDFEKVLHLGAGIRGHAGSGGEQKRVAVFEIWEHESFNLTVIV
jgi:hypothetical protein